MRRTMKDRGGLRVDNPGGRPRSVFKVRLSKVEVQELHTLALVRGVTDDEAVLLAVTVGIQALKGDSHE